MTKTEKKVVEWLINGETGVSSEILASTFLGIKVNNKFGMRAPSDPSDFCRCLKLIQEIPEIRTILPEVAKLTPKWKKFVKNWDELEKSFMDEVPGWITGKDIFVKAPKTYALMRRLEK